MVGEVRDEETVELAQGCLRVMVFSTIHTNDSVAGFTRLLNWGMEPFNYITVKGILAQRLVENCVRNVVKNIWSNPQN